MLKDLKRPASAASRSARLRSAGSRSARFPLAALLVVLSLAGSSAVRAIGQTAAQVRALQRMAGAHTNAANPYATDAADSNLAEPAGVAFDSAGNLFIADVDDNKIREVSTLGNISTVAGTGEEGFAGDGGPATSAILDSPAGVTVDLAGNVYIADSHNQRIRKISNGTIQTIAGTGVPGFAGDGGSALSARLNLPTAVTVDAAGNVYFTDTNNHRVRKISGTTISTVAGNGEQIYLGDGVLATQTGLDSPAGVAVDSAGNLYIGDTHNQRVRMVTQTTGIISTIAGNGTKTFGGDGGVGTLAAVARPRGVAVSTAGSLYVADSDNHRIRLISLASGKMTTFSGDGEQGFAGDIGTVQTVLLDTPRSVAVGPSGALAVSDTQNQRVREITPSGSETVAGTGNTGTPAILLTGPATATLGTATLTATLASVPANTAGTITFYDVTSGTPVAVGSAPVVNGAAQLFLTGITAGIHRYAAKFLGNSVTPVLTSGVIGIAVTNASPVSNGFTIAATPALITVLPGQAASYQVAIHALDATFGSAVTLTASGLPPGAIANFTPDVIPGGAPAAASSVMVIQTAGQKSSRNIPLGPFSVPITVCLLCLPFYADRRIRKQYGQAVSLRIFSFLLLLVGVASLSGCGNGGFFGQGPKTYIITVTGTSAATGTNPAVSHSATVSLTVE